MLFNLIQQNGIFNIFLNFKNLMRTNILHPCRVPDSWCIYIFEVDTACTGDMGALHRTLHLLPPNAVQCSGVRIWTRSFSIEYCQHESNLFATMILWHYLWFVIIIFVQVVKMKILWLPIYIPWREKWFFLIMQLY